MCHTTPLTHPSSHAEPRRRQIIYSHVLYWRDVVMITDTVSSDSGCADDSRWQLDRAARSLTPSAITHQHTNRHRTSSCASWPRSLRWSTAAHGTRPTRPWYVRGSVCFSLIRLHGCPTTSISMTNPSPSTQTHPTTVPPRGLQEGGRRPRPGPPPRPLRRRPRAGGRGGRRAHCPSAGGLRGGGARRQVPGLRCVGAALGLCGFVSSSEADLNNPNTYLKPRSWWG
jgi:hypothetical protein